MPMQGGRPRPLRFLLLLFAAAILSGCTTIPTAPPGKSELSAIDAGKMTLLLLRVVVSIEGEAHPAFFPGPVLANNISVLLGTFETGGQPRPVDRWSFSEDSLAQGWVYLYVPPGPQYLAFSAGGAGMGGAGTARPGSQYLDFHAVGGGAAQFKRMQRWRVDVPEGSKLVYAGTMAVDGAGISRWLPQAPLLRNFSRMEVRDESGEAQVLADRYLPGLGPIETALMQRHDGPIILRTPKN